MEKYSILMSVYAKEKADHLKTAIESMLSQTVPSDDFVLVCDGPLTDMLDKVIAEYKDSIHILRLPENMGLGNALNAGMKICRHELIARMDSDDISLTDRCEKELKMFESTPSLDIAGGQICEFSEDPGHITGTRRVPLRSDDIIAFARKRNPFNHPSVMFRKSAVLAAGGYSEDFHLFEDYYLWARMLMAGCTGANHPDVLLKMRTSDDMYLRRGGREYAHDMLTFHKWLRKEKFTTVSDYLIGALPHAMICKMPASMRRHIYKFIHK